MSRAIVAIMGIVLVGAVSIFGFQAALADAGQSEVVINESWTPDPGNVTTLEYSNRAGAYYDNETQVYDSTSTEVERGVDYTWNDDNGTVTALEGGTLDGATNATITYEYQQPTEQQQGLANLLTLFTRFVPVLVPLFGFVLLLLIIK